MLEPELLGWIRRQRAESDLAAVAGASVLAAIGRDTVVDLMDSEAAAGPWLLSLLAVLDFDQTDSAGRVEPKAAAVHLDSAPADSPLLASHLAHFARPLYFFVLDCVNLRYLTSKLL